MKRFFLLTLIAGLLSPITAEAFGMNKREICARWNAKDRGFTIQDSERVKRKLGLKFDYPNTSYGIDKFCEY